MCPFGLLALAFLQAKPQIVPLQLVRSGITRFGGGSSTQTLALSTMKPSGLHNLPGGLTHPLYGTLTLSGVRFFVVLAMRGAIQKLLVDSNSNGDMGDDEPVVWRPKAGAASASGIAEVRIPFGGHRAAVNVIFIQSGPKSLTVLGDYGFAGQLALGSHDVPFYLVDGVGAGFKEGAPAGGTLSFNRGNSSGGTEHYESDKPFTINGTSLVLHSVSLSQATATFSPGEAVPERPQTVTVSIGHLAPTFTANTFDGKPVTFPPDFKGHIVLIYAWASWSAPSIQWLPRVQKAYEANKARGFDVLGVCLNQAKELDAAKSVAAQMHWMNVSDGKSWVGEPAKALNLEALPYLLLVDGTTGKVVSTMSEMAADGLDKVVSAALLARS